jgi:hypothetical protein
VIPYLVYLERRWQEGCQVGAQLWRELQAQGSNLAMISFTSVRR